MCYVCVIRGVSGVVWYVCMAHEHIMNGVQPKVKPKYWKIHLGLLNMSDPDHETIMDNPEDNHRPPIRIRGPFHVHMHTLSNLTSSVALQVTQESYAHPTNNNHSSEAPNLVEANNAKDTKEEEHYGSGRVHPGRGVDRVIEDTNARAQAFVVAATGRPLGYTYTQMAELLDPHTTQNTAPSVSRMTAAFNADYDSDDSIHNEGIPTNHVESTQAQRREIARTSGWLPPINRITHFDRGSLERYCEQVLFRYYRMLRDHEQK